MNRVLSTCSSCPSNGWWVRPVALYCWVYLWVEFFLLIIFYLMSGVLSIVCDVFFFLLKTVCLRLLLTWSLLSFYVFLTKVDLFSKDYFIQFQYFWYFETFYDFIIALALEIYVGFLSLFHYFNRVTGKFERRESSLNL